MDPLSIAIALAAKYVPDIIGHFSGQGAQKIAGQVIEVAKEVTGFTNPEEAKRAIEIDPAIANQFQLAVMDKKLEFERITVEETKAFLADRADARKRDTAFIMAGKNNTRGDTLAYGATAMLGLVIIMLFNPFGLFIIPPTNRELLLVVLGSLLVIVKDVYGFEFGSSKDSARSSQALTDIAKAP